MNFFKKNILVFLICNLAFFQLNAQRARVPNNPNYDLKPYHFGFMLGLNQMNFAIKPLSDLSPLDTLYDVESVPKLGFNIGIIADLKLKVNHQY